MSFLSNLFDKVNPLDIAKNFGFDIEALAPQATAGIVQMLIQEETDQGAQVVAVANLSEDKTQILLSLFKSTPDGLEKYKDIDLSNPAQLIQLLKKEKNTNDTAAHQFTAIGHQPAQTATDPAGNTTTTTDTEPGSAER
jgi:hypothetical protein